MENNFHNVEKNFQVLDFFSMAVEKKLQDLEKKFQDLEKKFQDLEIFFQDLEIVWSWNLNLNAPNEENVRI